MQHGRRLKEVREDAIVKERSNKKSIKVIKPEATTRVSVYKVQML